MGERREQALAFLDVSEMLELVSPICYEIIGGWVKSIRPACFLAHRGTEAEWAWLRVNRAVWYWPPPNRKACKRSPLLKAFCHPIGFCLQGDGIAAGDRFLIEIEARQVATFHPIVAISHGRTAGDLRILDGIASIRLRGN